MKSIEKSESKSTEKASKFDRQNSATSRTSNDSRDYMSNKYKSEDHSIKVVSNIDRQNSATSRTSNDSRDYMANKSVLPTIYCYKLGMDVIKPGAIDQIEKQKGAQMNKYIAIEGQTKSFVKLQWKGKINNINCLGCELPEFWSEGTGWDFGRYNLFTSSYSRGVLIPINDAVKSCESADESNHWPLSENDELTENNICCFQPLEKLSNDIEKNSRVFCQQLKAGGKCKWMGLINGKGYVGIEFDEIIPDGNSTQNSISKILKIQGQIQMIPVQSVLPTIYCDKLGLDVVKPGAIDQIEKQKGAQMNKYIAIQGKTKSFVKLFWKGKINNINYLGCELPEFWSGGTEGAFGRHKFFTYQNHRGVLIPINDAVKSCESAEESNHLPLTENDELTENNICCFQPLENLSNDIEKNSRVFCQQVKAGGKCKWRGLINGKGYVGIEFDEIHRRAERFNELSRILKIDDRIRIIPLECVENAKLHFIFDKIVDTGKIFYVDCEEDRDYLGNFGAINLTTRDGKSKQFIGELKWIGKINNEKCVGLDMEDETEFGMDGIINQDNRFDCMEKHGLITVLSNVKLYKYDNNIHMLPSGIINPDKYLRCKETIGDEFIKAQRIKKDGMVNVKLLNGQANLKGTLKWYGLMNNVPVCAVQLLQEHENGTNGRFWRTRLFECRDKLAIATLTQNLSPSMPIDLINDVFVEKNQKEFSRGSIRTDDIYHVGQFVKILPFDLFGQIECFHVVYKEIFVQIQLTKNQIKRLPFHQRIDRAAGNAIYSTVILLKDSIAKCSENLEFLNESSLIKKECIEYQILRPMETFQKGDLIKAGKTGNVKYFIVNNRFIINGIFCLSVMESILGEAEEYLPESEAIKVDNSELEMKYFQGVFIDPKSIRSFEKCENNDFCIGNRVEFMSMDRKSSYKGRIKSIGMANKTIPSCVVRVPPSEPIVNRSLLQYTLNENLKFKILSGTANDFLFLIPANLLRKSELPETVNGIPVINPEFIRIIEGAAVEPAKFIVFTWNNERHSVQLKWKGLIDQKYCLGCVANFQWNFGTNGTFGQDKLFACEDKHGILIPLAAVSECCEIKGHKPIKWTRDGAIDENSICCTVEKNITKFQANCKLKNIKSNKKAIWKWSGLVNDVEVIGVEMNESLEKGTNGNFCKIQLFRSVTKRGALFKSEEFINSKSELKHVKEINLNVVDPFNVREIENGRQINKSACYKSKGAIKILNIKWRGIVNGELCVGCELSGPVEWGTDGTFGNKIVFKCPDRRGVLIPTEELIDSCETTAHLKITTLRDSGWLWKGDTYFINPDCICCTESTECLKQHPDLRIKSRIKVPNKENKQIGGSCEWIGLINGQEALGITMDNDVKGTNGIFSYFRMFACESGKGVLMLAENIVHDKESEKPQFIADKIVDINKIYSIFPCEVENGIGIGKPIKINLNSPNGRNRDFIGEVKWTGRINDEKCVGLDMEEEMEHGMDGMIGKSQRFECMEKHGLVALLSDVELSENAENPQVLDSGMIAPNKFIRFQEERSKKYLDDKNIKIDEFVFVKQENPELKLKGKLRWIGWMNKLLVCVIELDQDHENGSNGTFWRRRIVNSHGKRVIATNINNVCKYEPYVSKAIPEEIQIFKEIVINSAVKYYFLTATGYQDLFGTVKWTGVDEKDSYFFGLELDDNIAIGTDGTFEGQRLFTCQNGHGVLAPLNTVASDTRFTAKETQHEEFLSAEIENYELIIKMLLANEGDVNKLNTNQESIFDIANNLRNESFVNVMLDHCKQPLELSVTKSFEMILSNLVESENWDLLSQIIDHARVDEISNKYLMSLSISVLKKQKTTELFGKIMSLCLDKNIIFCGGETFVTALIKSGIHSSTMVSILARKLFDINKTNLGNETPLVLACEGLLLDVVKVLVALNCDLKRYRHEAIESAVLAKLKAKNENNHLKVDLGSQIIKLLSETIDNDSIQCNICMDRSIDTVLNCGHTFCLNCANEFHKCPNCNLDVSSYTKIFL